MMIGAVVHRGGCHCGAVRFELEAPARLDVVRCNCSICTRTGFLHYFTDHQSFRLLSGQDQLTTYRFGSGTARHTFCRHCGVKAFYVPRSHPDGYSVNVHCIDPGSIEAMDITDFDGANWEKNIAQLRPDLADRRP